MSVDCKKTVISFNCLLHKLNIIFLFIFTNLQYLAEMAGILCNVLKLGKLEERSVLTFNITISLTTTINNKLLIIILTNTKVLINSRFEITVSSTVPRY